MKYNTKKWIFLACLTALVSGPLASQALAYKIVVDKDGMPIRIIKDGNPYPEIVEEGSVKDRKK